MTFSRLTPFLQCLGTPISRSGSHHSCPSKLTLAACSSHSLCTQHLSRGVFHSQDAGNNFNLSPWTLLLHAHPTVSHHTSSPPTHLAQDSHNHAGTGAAGGEAKRPADGGFASTRIPIKDPALFPWQRAEPRSAVPSRSGRAPCPTPLNPRPGLPAVTLRAPSKARQIRAHTFPTHDVPARKRQIKMCQLIAVTEITPPIPAEL